MNKSVISFETACEAKGIETHLPDVSMIPEKYREFVINSYKLAVSTDAVNDGWEPDYTKHDQPKYEPVFEVQASEENPSGSGLSLFVFDCWYTHAFAGSRLCVETSEGVRHMVKHFKAEFEGMILRK